MKVAPILSALERAGHERVFVHTGQHYDATMSDAFFRDLRLPEPDFHLGVGSGSHARQTARIMEGFEPVLLESKPQWVVVVGDVNSTIACALVASKMRHEHDCRIAHVEAGLRSNDWAMPEEVNRVLTDRLSDLLLTPSHDARPNLLREGIDERRIVFVGNVMIDSLLRMLPHAKALQMPERLGATPGAYAVATLHRPSNVDDAAQLEVILGAFAELTKRLPVLLPLHPRTRERIGAFGLDSVADGIRLMEPLGYSEMLGLQSEAALVVTDSGGMQEESTVLGIPCLTLRETTERPVTVTEGTNRMAPWPLTRDGILGAAESALAGGRVPVGARAPEGWDGKAGERIVAALEEGSKGESLSLRLLLGLVRGQFPIAP
ncbi:MAG: UDP-2,3-diacetamido-2,3-dideoxy-D-glucuronate 2-epimerase [Gemmatimonadaceae bacterium]|nr:UDP-2,3-diacetamido-2,3-dideoxy-D-glucuronate 2-epimerase [Gemmatimonadaceae bacterium]